MRETGIERIKNILKEIPFFEDFTNEELDFFSKQLSLRFAEKGTVLISQGDIGDYLFFIVEGMVGVKIRLESEEKDVGSYGWGACVGEMSIIDDYPRSATVVAINPSELLILTKAKFNSIIEKSPNLAIKVLKGISKNLSMRLRGQTGRFDNGIICK
jgi:CRP-like cAMP-binding protein